MASSENQGLQIALILFVMTTIILSVTTFVFFRQYVEADTRATNNKAGADKGAADLRTAQEEMNEMKRMIGIAESAPITEVRTQFEKDMTSLERTTPAQAERRFYRLALEDVMSDRDQRAIQVNDAQAEIALLKKKNLDFETAKQAQLAAAEASASQAADALAAAQQQHNEQLEAKNQVNSKLADDLATLGTQIADVKADAEKKVADAKSELAKLDELNQVKQAIIEKLDPATGFEVPDGMVRWVSQQGGSVWINVGRADGLQRQQIFSVYGADQNPGGEQKRKGSIEVTEVLDEHFAQARILDDELSNPIVAGDVIFTPLWHPGRGEHFGITGGIEIDGDGVDDRDFLRDLVKMHGGTIDAEVTRTGERTGQMTINTRYLIMGNEPGEGATDAHIAIVKEANELGVHTITIDKFLDQVGWTDKTQVLRFGPRGNALSATLEAPDGGRPAARGAVSERFRKRRPPAANGTNGKSAY